MASEVSPIPPDRPHLLPYITVADAARAIDFYRDVFGAVEIERLADPEGKVGHATLKLGDAQIMLSDEFPEWGAHGPATIGGSPVMLHLYLEDVDAIVARAVEAGAEIVEEVADQFYGDRGGKLVDPFGHRWWIATHIEDVSDEEMRRRAGELYGMG